MINHQCKMRQVFGLIIFVLGLVSLVPSMGRCEEPKPIVISEPEEPIEERMQRTITLDVRDMNVVDVIKFLALKGEFNIIVSPTVQGRSTVLLNSVSIRDAMDIVIISNKLAYKIQNNIVQVMTDGEYETIFGKRFSDMSEVEIIRLKYVKPSYALAALDNIKSNVGKIIIDEDTGSVVLIDTPDAIKQMKAAIEEIEKPLDTIVYTVQYADADVVADKLRARIDAKAVGSVLADERSNKIIVRAFPDRKKEIEEIIRSLDTATKAVLVDARILQLTFKPQYDFGIDWQLDFRDSPDNEIKKVSFKNVYLNKSSTLTTTMGQIAVGDFTKDAFETTVRALKQISDSKILSNPQILVTSGDEARIHIGDTVPYIISTTSGTGDNAITSEDVRFVDVGLKLYVSPVINEEGVITMRLRPEISTVVATVTSKGGGIPQVNKTEVETTVIVKDGQTVVMGGLKKDDKSHVRLGLPFLMDMPFIGNFFKRDNDDITSTEIVILITPHIVSGKDDYLKAKGTIKPYKTYSSDE